MSGCIGNMMRSPVQPLAELVDAVAEKWLAAEAGSAAELQRAYDEVIASFKPHEREEITFHGNRYLLSVLKSCDAQEGNPYQIKVHVIAQSG